MSEPLVAVVVPVYNGAAYLAECLDSLLRQTYPNWRATVVNNCSTDGTGALADGYARCDERITSVHAAEFLDQPGNYNRALSGVPPEARYVKVLEGDNWITEDALEQSVAIAETDERIGVVSGYALMGREILGHGVDSRQRVFEGGEVLQALLADETYLFGTPTNLLFRMSALRNIEPWFQPLFYDDADLCLRLLRRFRLGFVHQVLAFVRVENCGVFSSFQEFDYMSAFCYFAALDYGPEFLGPERARAAIRSRERAYYGRLARAVLGGRPRAYWHFNRGVLAARGDRIRRGPLVRALARDVIDMTLNPKSTVERLLRKVPHGA